MYRGTSDGYCWCAASIRVVSIVIRPAVIQDVDAVLLLWSAADAEPTHTDDVAAVSQLIAHDPGALLVAVSGASIVGSVIAAWDGWRGSIYRLAVAPEHRRRGLARRLLSAAEERLDGLGARRLQAIVVASHPHAVGFWRSAAWQEQVERLRFVRG